MKSRMIAVMALFAATGCGDDKTTPPPLGSVDAAASDAAVERDGSSPEGDAAPGDADEGGADAGPTYNEAHYVTQDGAGNQDGTSLSNAWAVTDFNDAANWSSEASDDDQIGPGDVVYVSGTIESEMQVRGSGAPGAYITIDGYESGDYDAFSEGSGPAVIDRGGADRSVGISLDLKVRSYVVFKDLIFTNCASGIVLFTDAEYFRIENCFFHDISQTAIDCVHANNVIVGGAPDRGNVLKNVSSVDTAAENIQFSGHDWVCSYNKFYAENGSERGNDFINSASGPNSNGLIEYNYFDNNLYENAIDLKNGAHHIVVRFNHFREDAAAGQETLQCNDDSHSIAIYGNLFDTNGTTGIGVIRSAANIHIYSNIFIHNAGRAVSSYKNNGNDIDGLFIYNNLIYENDGWGVYLADLASGTSAELKNNIFVRNDPADRRQVNIATSFLSSLVDYNHYYFDGSNEPRFYLRGGGDTISWADWRAAGYDEHGILSDPLVDDSDYTLRAASPCIDAGTPIADTNLPTITVMGTDIPLTYSEALDPQQTDWSTIPPTVVAADQRVHGSGWERGPYVYVE